MRELAIKRRLITDLVFGKPEIRIRYACAVVRHERHLGTSKSSLLLPPRRGTGGQCALPVPEREQSRRGSRGFRRLGMDVDGISGDGKFISGLGRPRRPDVACLLQAILRP